MTALLIIWAYSVVIIGVFGMPWWIADVNRLGREWRCYGYDRDIVKNMRRVVLIYPLAVIFWPVAVIFLPARQCFKSQAVRDVFTTIRVALIGR